MKVFISWSGSRSRAVAEALRDWLPNVLNALDPWLSFADIAAGARWHQEMEARLAATRFGILCLTPESQASSWLLYEAGALSRSTESARVVPYLIGLRQADLKGPLSYFQAVDADKEGTFEMLRSLNGTLEAAGELARPENALRRAHELWWPEIEPALREALSLAADVDAKAQNEVEGQLVHRLVQVLSDYQVVYDQLRAPEVAKPALHEEGKP